jgi:HSP20 family protein
MDAGSGGLLARAVLNLRCGSDAGLGRVGMQPKNTTKTRYDERRIEMLTRRIVGGHPALRLRNDMGRLFEDFFESVPAAATLGNLGRRPFPAVNVWEEETKLYVEAEIPGLKLEDLEILADGIELTIKGERKNGGEENVSFHRRERGVGTFSRMLRLPVEVDTDKVEATLRDGVLKITLPKAQAVLPRKIKVKS